MNDSIEQKRIEWVDIARGIGILLVIIGHQGLGLVSAWFYSFHMPLFFFLSGVCFKPKNSYKDFLLRKLRTMILPYFFLGIVAIFFQLLFYHYDFVWLRDALIKLVVQRKYMTIWFLACLFVTENIFYFLYTVVKKRKKRKIIILVSFSLFVVGAVYYRLGGIDLPWCIDTALMAMPFFCIGYYGKDKISNYTEKQVGREEVKQWIKLVCLGLLQVLLWFVNYKVFDAQFAMYNNQYTQELLTLPAAFLGIFCTIFIAQRCHSIVLRYIGKNSLIYFAWHQVMMFPIANILVYDWMAKVVGNRYILYAMFILTVLLLCTFANVVVMKTPLKICMGEWKFQKSTI